MKNDNNTSENLKKYKRSSKIKSVPPVLEYDLKQICKEGQELLDAEEKNKPITPPALTESNPYFKSRLEILKKYPQWRRNEVLTMEKNKDIDNQHYMAFVREVVSLGDKYSNINS